MQSWMFSQKMIYGDGSNPPAAPKMGIKLFLILLEVQLTDLQLYSDILSTWVRIAAFREERPVIIGGY